MLYVLGLSYGAVALALDALGVPLSMPATFLPAAKATI